MDKEYFMNTTMPVSWTELNCSDEQSLLNTYSSVDHFAHFDSALNSMVSSPAATSSGLSNDAFVLRELIGKLGGGGGGSFPLPPSSTAVTASRHANSHNATNESCYNTPLSSPPKLKLPILHHINMPNFGNSSPMNPPLPSLSTDPGFAERAAKFSCFGSRSFNGRTAPLGGMNSGEMVHRSSSPLKGNNGKLPRVSSSPSFKQGGLAIENKNLRQSQMETMPVNGFGKKSCANSNEESSVSEQIPSGETGSRTSNELNSRKRKAVSRGKTKEDGLNLVKGIGGHEDGNGKRSKPTETGKIENVAAKTEEETKGGSSNDESEKQKTNQKPPEPPKDYIHVRARRGQATDSHSLAERVRREKISERMKLLQDLVPGCNKVTGKALMLDEIINYVQSLQRQVEFLSMKLASVNPELDSNIDNLLTKDMFQQNENQPQQLYPMDSPSSAFYNHHNPNISSVPLSQNPVEPIPFGIQLPSADGFNQFPAFGEDDLHSIVQMGFGQNPGNFPVPNQISDMKIER